MARPDAAILHVLYVAAGLAPDQDPGVSRQLATVAEILRLGHRVTVLTADTSSVDLGTAQSALAGLPDSVRTVRVTMAPQQRDPLLNRWSDARMADPPAWEETAEKEQIRAFPEVFYGPWQPRAEAVAVRIHELDPVDLVLATATPYVDFAVALRLHADHGVSFVLDDTESWLLDPDTGDPSPLAERIEPWVAFGLSHALAMWFVSPAVADWHRSRFPQYADRIRVVGQDAMRYDAERAPNELLEPALQDVLSALAS